MVKQSPHGANGDGGADVAPSSSVAISATNGALTLTIRVTPRASRDALTLEEGQLRARLRAAPVEGAANTALLAFLAARLDLPRRAVAIAHGETARVKRISITGVTADDLRQRLARALSQPHAQ